MRTVGITYSPPDTPEDPSTIQGSLQWTSIDPSRPEFIKWEWYYDQLTVPNNTNTKLCAQYPCLYSRQVLFPPGLHNITLYIIKADSLITFASIEALMPGLMIS